ncbi:uridine diphosphate glucose pyrophosphatase [Ditylenchus destructor]|uniref:Uridine diphosphate glucose pyrophosphatase NUDT14 n=1 Tax=Ditylenchus destructor TaxID=166010 RepID=A0AAD4RAC1_9BILA|nr:uridine diphosphate glucose pyrophosphatase [Ditylenchus destructor]
MKKSQVEKGDSACQEVISDVTFDESVVQESSFVRPLRMKLANAHEPTKLFWDMALEHDSVAILLYHKEKQRIVLVKQFRPAVFVQRIRHYPENSGRNIKEIDWTKYENQMSVGETFELCAGLMDKARKTPVQTAQEEVLEECGYSVKPEDILFLKKYLTGIGISGSAQYLYYCEIDESMKASEGGGLKTEGEYIEKVYLTLDEARAISETQDDLSCPPSLLYALSWFLNYKAVPQNYN